MGTTTTPRMVDFFVKTEGHCFLCLSKVPTKLSTSPVKNDPDCDIKIKAEPGPGSFQQVQAPSSSLDPSSEKHSLQYLSRYLKLDLKVVLDRRKRGPPPPQKLLDRLKRSRLKVSLCEECAPLNGRFVKLYGQLERIGREVESCLRVIHGRVVQADSDCKKVPNPNPDGGDVKAEVLLLGGDEGDRETFKMLKEETLSKCLSRLEDFFVGNCFLCLSEISSQLPAVKVDHGDDDDDSKSELFRKIRPLNVTHSLQYLFHYLGSSTVGLSQQKRSKLRGSLCEECAALNGRFSELYKQLERVRMEVEFCLTAMRGRLTKNNCEVNTVVKSGGDREILKRLRGETLQKCLSRLNRTTPKVTVSKLTSEDLRRQTTLRHPAPFNEVTKVTSESSEFEIDSESETSNSDIDWTEVNIGTKRKRVKIKMKEGNVMKKKRSHSSLKKEKDPDSDPEKPRRYACRICGLKFTRNENLTAHHLSIHLQIKRYQCEECGEHFSRSNGLQAHRRRVHSKGIRFQCSLCGRGFGQSIHLSRHHRIVHLKIKDCECTECGWKFSTPSNLRTHFEAAHLHITQTEQRLRSKVHRQRIMKKKVVQFIHKCDLCGEEFSQKTELKLHHKRFHVKPTKSKSKPCPSDPDPAGFSSEMKEEVTQVESPVVKIEKTETDLKSRIICKAPPALII